MQSDDVIWQVINNGFCSFKVKTDTGSFCRNENNVTGLCNKQSCPLANSRYATVREVGGVCYLYKKVPERAHMPVKMWEKVKLKGSTEQACEKIKKELEFMPEFLKAKCQARLIRLREVIQRTERLKNDPNQPVLSVKKMKVIRREASREARAKKVALVENAIEKELLDRLQKGVYGEIYNLPQVTFDQYLEQNGEQQELDEESADEAEAYFEGEEEEEDESEVEYEEEFDESDIEDIQDLEDIVSVPANKKKAYVEIEYENEGPSRSLAK